MDILTTETAFFFLQSNTKFRSDSEHNIYGPNFSRSSIDSILEVLSFLSSTLTMFH